MNKVMFFLIVKNKLHLFKGVIRHTWQIVLGYLTIFLFFCYQLFGTIQIKTGIPTNTHYMMYTFGFVILVNFYRVFISKTPTFKMNAATLLHLYNTKRFAKIVYTKYFFSAIISLSFSLCVSFFLHGSVFGIDFFRMFVILAELMFSNSIMAWIYYHGSKKTQIIMILIFSFVAAFAFNQTVFSAIILFAICIGLTIYSLCCLNLNIPKYYERLCFIDTAMAAQSQNNLAKMIQLANENRPQRVYGISLKNMPLSKRNALLCKSILRLLRMQKQVVVILILIFVVAWTIGCTTILNSFPLLDVPEIRRGIMTIIITLGLCFLQQMFVKESSAIIEKQKLGLFLPYNRKEILLGHLPVPTVLNLFISLLVSVLFAKLSLVFFIWVLLVIVYFIQSYLEIYCIREKNFVCVCLNLLILIGVYCFL